MKFASSKLVSSLIDMNDIGSPSVTVEVASRSVSVSFQNVENVEKVEKVEYSWGDYIERELLQKKEIEPLYDCLRKVVPILKSENFSREKIPEKIEFQKICEVLLSAKSENEDSKGVIDNALFQTCCFGVQQKINADLKDHQEDETTSELHNHLQRLMKNVLSLTEKFSAIEFADTKDYLSDMIRVVWSSEPIRSSVYMLVKVCLCLIVPFPLEGDHNSELSEVMSDFIKTIYFMCLVGLRNKAPGLSPGSPQRLNNNDGELMGMNKKSHTVWGYESALGLTLRTVFVNKKRMGNDKGFMKGEIIGELLALVDARKKKCRENFEMFSCIVEEMAMQRARMAAEEKRKSAEEESKSISIMKNVATEMFNNEKHPDELGNTEKERKNEKLQSFLKKALGDFNKKRDDFSVLVARGLKYIYDSEDNIVKPELAEMKKKLKLELEKMQKEKLTGKVPVQPFLDECEKGDSFSALVTRRLRCIYESMVKIVDRTDVQERLKEKGSGLDSILISLEEFEVLLEIEWRISYLQIQNKDQKDGCGYKMGQCANVWAPLISVLSAGCGSGHPGYEGNSFSALILKESSSKKESGSKYSCFMATPARYINHINSSIGDDQNRNTTGKTGDVVAHMSFLHTALGKPLTDRRPFIKFEIGERNEKNMSDFGILDFLGTYAGGQEAAFRSTEPFFFRFVMLKYGLEDAFHFLRECLQLEVDSKKEFSSMDLEKILHRMLQCDLDQKANAIHQCALWGNIAPIRFLLDDIPEVLKKVPQNPNSEQESYESVVQRVFRKAMEIGDIYEQSSDAEKVFELFLSRISRVEEPPASTDKQYFLDNLIYDPPLFHLMSPFEVAILTDNLHIAVELLQQFEEKHIQQAKRWNRPGCQLWKCINPYVFKPVEDRLMCLGILLKCEKVVLNLLYLGVKITEDFLEIMNSTKERGCPGRADGSHRSRNDYYKVFKDRSEYDYVSWSGRMSIYDESGSSTSQTDAPFVCPYCAYYCLCERKTQHDNEVWKRKWDSFQLSNDCACNVCAHICGTSAEVKKNSDDYFLRNCLEAVLVISCLNNDRESLTVLKEWMSRTKAHDERISDGNNYLLLKEWVRREKESNEVLDYRKYSIESVRDFREGKETTLIGDIPKESLKRLEELMDGVDSLKSTKGTTVAPFHRKYSVVGKIQENTRLTLENLVSEPLSTSVLTALKGVLKTLPQSSPMTCETYEGFISRRQSSQRQDILEHEITGLRITHLAVIFCSWGVGTDALKYLVSHMGAPVSRWCECRVDEIESRKISRIKSARQRSNSQENLRGIVGDADAPSDSRYLPLHIAAEWNAVDAAAVILGSVRPPKYREFNDGELNQDHFTLCNRDANVFPAWLLLVCREDYNTTIHDIDSPDFRGFNGARTGLLQTPLHIACARDHQKILKLFCEQLEAVLRFGPIPIEWPQQLQGYLALSDKKGPQETNECNACCRRLPLVENNYEGYNLKKLVGNFSGHGGELLLHTAIRNISPMCVDYLVRNWEAESRIDNSHMLVEQYGPAQKYLEWKRKMGDPKTPTERGPPPYCAMPYDLAMICQQDLEFTLEQLTGLEREQEREVVENQSKCIGSIVTSIHLDQANVEYRKRVAFRDSFVVMIFLLFFLVLFTILCFWRYTRDDGRSAQVSNAFTTVILEEPISNTVEAFETAFADIVSHANLNAWLQGPFHGGVYPDSKYEVAGMTTLVGLIRIRQVRSGHDDCQVTSLGISSLVSDTSQCMQQSTWFDVDKSDRSETVGGVTASDHRGDGFQTPSVLNTWWTQFYREDGWEWELSADGTTALNQLTTLESSNWLDQKTRAVIVDLSTYNAHLNLFYVGRFIVEFPVSGGAIPKAEVYVGNFLPYLAWSNGGLIFPGVLLLLLEMAGLVFSLFQLSKEIHSNTLHIWRTIKKKCSNTKSKFHMDVLEKILSSFLKDANSTEGVWNMLEAIFNVLVIASYCLHFSSFVIALTISYDANEYIDMHRVAVFHDTGRLLLSVSLWIGWLRILKVSRNFPTLGPFVDSVLLSVASQRVLIFLLIVLVFLFATALSFTIAFGFHSLAHATVYDSLLTLGGGFFGDFDISELAQQNRVFGPFMMYTFLVATTFVLLNLFVAIIGETYSEAINDSERVWQVRIRDVVVNSVYLEGRSPYASHRKALKIAFLQFFKREFWSGKIWRLISASSFRWLLCFCKKSSSKKSPRRNQVQDGSVPSSADEEVGKSEEVEESEVVNSKGYDENADKDIETLFRYPDEMISYQFGEDGVVLYEEDEGGLPSQHNNGHQNARESMPSLHHVILSTILQARTCWLERNRRQLPITHDAGGDKEEEPVAGADAGGDKKEDPTAGANGEAPAHK